MEKKKETRGRKSNLSKTAIAPKSNARITDFFKKELTDISDLANSHHEH